MLVELLRAPHALKIEGDAFGHVYEYFMSDLAKETMQEGREFFTPSSIVRLIIEILEPLGGRILDPACGSAGMFVRFSFRTVRNIQKFVENVRCQCCLLKPPSDVLLLKAHELSNFAGKFAGEILSPLDEAPFRPFIVE